MQALLDAIARMERPTEAARIFHGRGGLHPGCEDWALDAFPPVLLLTSFRPVDDAALAIEMGADAIDIGKTIHPHPTLGESIGLAAEAAHGSCTDLPPVKR